jgi:hypothetical protein
MILPYHYKWEMGLTIVRTNKRNEWPTHDHAGNGNGGRKVSDGFGWLRLAGVMNILMSPMSYTEEPVIYNDE